MKLRTIRSYGGKARIWLKRKKGRSSADSALENRGGDTSSRRTLSNAVDASSRTEILEKSISNALVEVGWDENLCRPVYLADEDSCPNLAQTNDRNEVTDEDEEGFDFAPKAPSKDYVVRRPRKYGSKRKRRNYDVSYEAEYVVSKELLDHSADESSKRNRRQGMSFSDCPTPNGSQIFSRSSICQNLDSAMKPTMLMTANCKPKESSQYLHSNDDGYIEKQTSAVDNARPVATSVFDFVDERVHCQPSCATAVDAAKAFFERLDSTQKLVLDDSISPQPRSRTCARTSRSTDLTNSALLQEYESYVAAAKASSVEPLPITEYVANRGTFFCVSGIYDGFLDE